MTDTGTNELLRRHIQSPDILIRCSECGEKWPCTTIQLITSLEAVRINLKKADSLIERQKREIERLEAQVARVESAYYAQRLTLLKLSAAAKQGVTEAELLATATPPSPEVGE